VKAPQKMTKKTAPKTTRKKATRPAPTQKTAPAPERRTIKCKICKAEIEISPGLDEMVKHWEDEHPDALAKMRGKHVDEPDRTGW
jgi:hypothetical protein